MKVNHFNTYPHGGAANAALRIHNGLLQQGVNSNFLYRINDKPELDLQQARQIEFENTPAKPSKLFGPIQKKLDKRRRKQIHRLYDIHLADRQQNVHEVFSMARLPDTTRFDWNENSSNLVHLHWLAFMVDYPTFFQSIPDSVPIVWTLHDMSPFTGGCHYSSHCEQFRQGCGNCPQVVVPKSNDVSADSLLAKTKALRNKSIHVVAPSRWLIELAQQSPVWPSSTEFSVIHYGLNLKTFRPLNKATARTSFAIEQAPVVIGFGADDLSNQRKGFSQLIEALHLVAEKHDPQQRPIELAVFGKGAIPEDLAQKFVVNSFGFVQDTEKLVEIYSACDFVVVPSLEDNQPQVGLESMACGRAVIGFDAGGIPEYVDHNETGLLVAARDTRGLADAILGLAATENHYTTMGQQAREKVEREFEMVQQTRRYVELYRRLTGTQDLRNQAA